MKLKDKKKTRRVTSEISIISDCAVYKLCSYMELKGSDSTLPYVQAPYEKTLEK